MVDKEARYCFEFEYSLDDIVSGMPVVKSTRRTILFLIIVAIVFGIQFVGTVASMLELI